MKDTKIQWCDHTFNHVVGCTKVSPGCAHCYADEQTRRFGKDFTIRTRTSAANWRGPVKWNNYRARCEACGHWNHPTSDVCQADNCATMGDDFEIVRPRVFCASMSDWLDDADVRMPDGRIDRGGVETLADLLDLIRMTPNLDWLLLTKRPENWKRRMTSVCNYWHDRDSVENWTSLIHDWAGGSYPPNVWIGVSAENQEYWDKRVPLLLDIPAQVRFVSVEPMLGPIDMRLMVTSREPICDKGGAVIDYRLHSELIDWVIFGGESGPRARPCNVEWIRDGVRQCREAGVAAFVKQLGAVPKDRTGIPFGFARKGYKWDEPSEWPEDLRVREWPGGAR